MKPGKFEGCKVVSHSDSYHNGDETHFTSLEIECRDEDTRDRLAGDIQKEFDRINAGWTIRKTTQRRIQKGRTERIGFGVELHPAEPIWYERMNQMMHELLDDWEQ